MEYRFNGKSFKVTENEIQMKNITGMSGADFRPVQIENNYDFRIIKLALQAAYESGARSVRSDIKNALGIDDE